MGWRDGSVIKNTGCSCRGPRFSSQHPHGGSQPSVTPAPGNLMPSSGLSWHPPTHTETPTYTHKQVKQNRRIQRNQGGEDGWLLLRTGERPLPMPQFLFWGGEEDNVPTHRTAAQVKCRVRPELCTSLACSVRVVHCPYPAAGTVLFSSTTEQRDLMQELFNRNSFLPPS